MPTPAVPPAQPDNTRDALIAAGLHFFGHKGFAASSTREIAARAGANIAAIAYHFGGKDGLRRACAETVVARLGDVFVEPEARTLDEPEARTPAGPEARTPDAPEARTPDAPEVRTPDAPEVRAADAGVSPPVSGAREVARARLVALVRAVTAFLGTGRTGEDVAAFILREVTEAGPEMETLYTELVGPRHRDLCRLWAAATGTDPESEDTRLAVFAMMGQVLYFRIGRPLILRRMDWDDIGPRQAAAIADTLVRQLHAALDATERTGP